MGKTCTCCGSVLERKERESPRDLITGNIATSPVELHISILSSLEIGLLS
jgi:hypothetical protein